MARRLPMVASLGRRAGLSITLVAAAGSIVLLLVAAESCWGQGVKSSYSMASSKVDARIDSDFIHTLTVPVDLATAMLESGSLFNKQGYNDDYDDTDEPLDMPFVILLLAWLASSMLPTSLREPPKLSFICSLVLERPD